MFILAMKNYETNADPKGRAWGQLGVCQCLFKCDPQAKKYSIATIRLTQYSNLILLKKQRAEPNTGNMYTTIFTKRDNLVISITHIEETQIVEKNAIKLFQ